MQKFITFVLIFGILSVSYVSAQDVRLTLFEGHHSAVKSVEFSADNKWVLTVPEAGAIKIWQATTGQLLHSVMPSYNVLVGAFFNAKSDGIIIISSNSIGTDHSGGAFVEEFNLATGKRIHEVKFEGLGCPFAWSCVSGYEFDQSRSWLQLSSTGQNLLVNLSKWTTGIGYGSFLENGQTIEIGKVSPTTHKTKVSLRKIGSPLVTAQLLVPENDPEKSFMTVIGNELYVFPGKGDEVPVFDLKTSKQVRSIHLENDLVNVKHSENNKLLLYGDKSWSLIGPNNETVRESNSAQTPDEILLSGALLAEVIKFQSHTGIRVWSTATGELKNHFNFPHGHVILKDDKLVLLGEDGGIEIFEATTGKSILVLHGHSNPVFSVSLGNNADVMLMASPLRNAEMIDLTTGNVVNRFEHTATIADGMISPDGKRVFTVSADKKIKIWDPISGDVVHVNNSRHQDQFWPVAFSHDGKTLATGCDGGTGMELWDVETGKYLDVLPDKPISYYQSVTYSEDGSLIVAARDQSIHIWNSATKDSVNVIKAHDKVRGASVSPNNKFVATSVYGTATAWDIKTGKELFSERVGDPIITDFSSDGKFLVVGTVHAGIRLIDVATWQYKRTVPVPSGVRTIYHLKDDLMLTTSIDNSTQLVALTDGRVLKQWQGFVGDVSREKGRIALINDNSGITIIDLKTQDELLTYYAVGKDDWVVTHPSGLFDASPGASSKLYFVQGTDFIRFDQIKHRYYEPGLWKKVMTGEKLRDVAGFRSIALPPEIHLGEVDEKGYLTIELVNKGGGIGEVSILLHGKEIVKDARPKDADPDAAALTVKYYVANHKNLRKDVNMFTAKAWNKDHWVEGRSEVVTYVKGEKDNYKPAVHILVCGVSDYAGGAEIDLKFAAKDAEDVAKACSIGAQRLFGTDKKFVYTLTTSQPKEHWPTRENILKTFKEIEAKAHPADVVVVYLSGHGINIGGAEGDWYYLTQEAFATSLSSFSDPAVREKSTISSNELVELFNANPAEKQVLVIDACASGRIVDNLVARKDIPSATLRAIDRMKDRTGMHIITGCTADAVSYEASRYGQGVLTYSLLEGIRGAALRDYEFVDVSQLFRYAQDRVPVLATGIGGIQSPMVFSPNAGQSFDIGQLTDDERKTIPISKIRPVYIQSNFQDEDEMADVLDLGKKVDVMLNEASAKGIDAPLIFVPVREYPEGCQLIGRYHSENGKITLRLRKKCEGNDATITVSAPDVNQLTAEVAKVVTN